MIKNMNNINVLNVNVLAVKKQYFYFNKLAKTLINI